MFDFLKSKDQKDREAKRAAMRKVMEERQKAKAAEYGGEKKSNAEQEAIDALQNSGG